MLRHPIQRWFSAYFFNHAKKHPHSSIDEELGSYIETDKAAQAGQVYVEFLTASRDGTPMSILSETVD